MNQFKLVIYKWDLHQALKHYNQDNFCYRFCLCGNDPVYGCSKDDTNCVFEHSYDIKSFIAGHGSIDKNTLQNCVQWLCFYFLCVGNGIASSNYSSSSSINLNAGAYLRLGDLWQFTGIAEDDYSKADRFYLKSLNEDKNCYKLLYYA